MEAQLIVEGICPWKSFDDLEEELILDELLLLHETMAKSKNMHYRMLASFQGIDLGGNDDTPIEGADDLPDEVLRHEREWQEKKKAANESGEAAETSLSKFGLGYSQA